MLVNLLSTFLKIFSPKKIGDLDSKTDTLCKKLIKTLVSKKIVNSFAKRPKVRDSAQILKSNNLRITQFTKYFYVNNAIKKNHMTTDRTIEHPALSAQKIIPALGRVARFL
jgi:hypothetical protein